MSAPKQYSGFLTEDERIQVRVGDVTLTAQTSRVVTFESPFTRPYHAFITLMTKVNQTLWVEALTPNGFTIRSDENVNGRVAYLAVEDRQEM